MLTSEDIRLRNLRKLALLARLLDEGEKHPLAWASTYLAFNGDDELKALSIQEITSLLRALTDDGLILEIDSDRDLPYPNTVKVSARGRAVVENWITQRAD